MIVLNLGWGLQSFTIAAMMALGEMEKCDVAISADTTWESEETYAFAREWQEWLFKHDVPVLWAFDENAHEWINKEWEGTFIPAYTLNNETGKRGILDRQCTDRWKIQPIRHLLKHIVWMSHLPFTNWSKAHRYSDYYADYGPDYLYSRARFNLDEKVLLRVVENIQEKYDRIEVANQWAVDRECSQWWEKYPWPIAPHPRLKTEAKINAAFRKWKSGKQWFRLYMKPNTITQYLGITLDEVERAKPSEVKWIRHEYPLLDRKMYRSDCELFLKKAGLPIPPKSACIFCPFTSKLRWVEKAKNNRGDFIKAVCIDHFIRKQRPGHTIYVHDARTDLYEAVYTSTQMRQPMLFDVGVSTNACGPHCWM